MSVAKILSYLVLKDSDSNANKDLIPMPSERRLWGWQSFFGFWALNGICYAQWTVGSSLLSLGLNVPQCIGIMVVSNLLATTLATICSQSGTDFHIGFSMTQRIIFGKKLGSIIPMLTRIIVSIVWFANDSFAGGLCLNCCFAALSPSFFNMKNTFPDSLDLTSQQLVGYCVFLIICAIFFVIPPEKWGRHTIFSAVLTFFAALGIVTWAVVQEGGNGPLMSQKTSLSSSQTAWAWFSGISSFYGAMTNTIANQNDYSRFARTKRSPHLSIHISYNVFGLVFPLMGVVSGSALYGKFNAEYWNPNDIVMLWLQQNYNAKSRAAAFFVGLLFAYSQLVYAVLGDAFSASSDLAGVFPRFINIKIGLYVCLLLSWTCQGWLFFNTSSAFLSVMSSFSVFMTPLIAISICDYWLIRHRKLRLYDLYFNDDANRNCYRYFHQFNLRAVVAYVFGFAFALPGLANTANENIIIPNGFIHFFEGNWLFEFVISFSLYYVLCKIWPMEGQGEVDEYDYFGIFNEEERERLGMLEKPQVVEEHLVITSDEEKEK